MKLRVLVLLLALGLVAAACSGEESEGVASLAAGAEPAGVPSDAQDDAADLAVDQEQAMLDFAACMRDNDVEIDDPTVDADGNVEFGRFRGVAEAGEVDREAIRDVMEECSEHLAGLALGRGGGDLDPTELQDTLVEYAACMRDNGFDMPDPDFSNFGPGAGEPGQGGGPFGAIDFDDADFVVAQEACADVLGGIRAPGGGPRTGGSGG